MIPSAVLEAALEYAARGWRVIPLHNPTGDPAKPCSCNRPDCDKPGKHPRILAWPTNASTEPAVIRRWWSQWPQANVGIACGPGSNLWAMDVDGEPGRVELRRLQQLHEGDLPITPRSFTGGGGEHWLFAHEPGLKNEVRFAPGLDIRTEGGLIVAPPSIHASGTLYQWDSRADPSEVPVSSAPEWLIQVVRTSGTAAPRAAIVTGGKIPDGQRNTMLHKIGSSLRRYGAERVTILGAISAENTSRCDPPLSEFELDEIASSCMRYQPSPEEVEVKLGTNGKNGHDGPFVVNIVGRKVVDPPKSVPEEAMYGLPGDVVRAIEPHTESHPAAILATFLTGVGCMLGGKVHIFRDGSHQTANEFAVLVGRSAIGRKGTAQRRAEEVLKGIKDCKSNIEVAHDMREEGECFYDSLRLAGLGSGEAMVEALADKDSDRRRIIVEQEFSRCLKVMRRDGSTLSETLRSAWDGDVLSNRTKGKHYRAVDTHISVLGHITEAELKSEMANVSIYNGFANRFLWVYCGRSKSLPRGGGKTPIAVLTDRVQAALAFAHHLGQVEFNDRVMAAWDEGGVYELLNDEKPGLLGAITSRAAAHVTRLAVIYMCMDLEAEVNEDHFLAALAFWEYSVKSAEYLFGQSTGDDTADRIDEALCEVSPGGLDRTRIRDLFSRNAAPGRIPAALALLKHLGRARVTRIDSSGRPTEVWSATRDDLTTYDINDKSPLQLAKKLLGR